MVAGIEIDVIGLGIILIVLLNIPLKSKKLLFDQKLFLSLMFFTSLAMVCDILQWSLDGKAGSIIRTTQYVNTIIFFGINPIPCILYHLYVDYQIHRNKKKTKKRFFAVMPPAILNMIFVLISPIKHFIFYLDAENIYHRGSFFLLLPFICYFYIMITLGEILWNKKNIKKDDFAALLVFAIPPILGGIVQTLFYGTTLLWVSVSLGILIVYINIQNRDIYTDYLTGLNNRMQLDIYLKEMIGKESKENQLAGIMLDINDFKKINDQYGHDMGDQALKAVSKILKKSFGKDDFIARYGGDEFVVVFEIKKQSDMEEAILRIKKHTEEFNTANHNPYQLSLSTGYDIISNQKDMTVQKYLKRIDQLMYEDKQKQKNRV